MDWMDWMDWLSERVMPPHPIDLTLPCPIPAQCHTRLLKVPVFPFTSFFLVFSLSSTFFLFASFAHLFFSFPSSRFAPYPNLPLNSLKRDHYPHRRH